MKYPYQSLFLNMEMGDAVTATELSSISFDPSGSFAIDFWIMLSDCNTTKILLSKEGNLSLQIRKDKVEFCVQGYQPVIAKEAILPNVWVHVAISCYHKNVRIFLDGTPVVETRVTGSELSSVKPVRIGGDFFGALRLLRLYNNALTAQEVQEAMHQYTLTNEMNAFYDFTCNPPKEVKSGKTLSLPQTCKVLCAMSSAEFKNGAYLDASQSEPVNPAGKRNTPYTIQMWVCLAADVEAPICTLFYNANQGGTVGMELSLVNSGSNYHIRMSHGVLENKDHQLETTETLSKGIWYNLAVTWKNKTLTLYLDGVKIAQKPEMGIPDEALTKKTTFIGAKASRYNPNGENGLAGYISRVDVWDIELNSFEIKTYASQEPDWKANGLTGSWSFFTNYVSNRVDLLPLVRVNDLRIKDDWMPAKENQFEQHEPLLKGEREPLSPEQLAECRERAMADVDEINVSSMGLRMNTCQVEDMVYFVLHDATHSYTACSLSKAEVGDDPMLTWYIGLIVILLGSIVSLIFSMNLTYTTRLGTYLNLAIANNPQILILLSSVRDTSSALAFFVSFFKIIISRNQMWELLTICVNLGFWSLTSGLIKLAAKVFGGPVAWAVWGAITAGAIIYHFTKKPQPLPTITINSIQFNHSQANSICSINIRRNETTTWPLPEWTPTTEWDRVPAVYRIGRFAANPDPLQIAVRFKSANLLPHVVTIRGISSGTNTTLMGDTDTINVFFMNGKSLTVLFTLANHTLALGGIKRADFSWSWKYLEDGETKNIKTTNHKLYTILDSVHKPWSSAPDLRNNPWTDCLDMVYPWIMGQTKPQDVAGALTAGLYNLAKATYSGAANYSFNSEVDGVLCHNFLLSEFMANWATATTSQKIGVNCEDCCAFVSIFSNLVGCDLWRAGFSLNFTVNNLLLIGETIWRQPVGGVFEYHAVACKVTGNITYPLDPTQFRVYDPCLQYHSAGNVVLAQHVQMSQYAAQPTAPVVPAPVAGFYREDLVPNTAAGLSQCQLIEVVRLTI